MAEKTGGTKREAAMLNPLERFFERVHNEPKHAAYFAKKIAREMADSLGNHNGWRFSVRHGREVASLRHWEKSKVLRPLKELQG
jgi:carbohydrate-selective porin OprB